MKPSEHLTAAHELLVSLSDIENVAPSQMEERVKSVGAFNDPNLTPDDLLRIMDLTVELAAKIEKRRPE